VRIDLFRMEERSACTRTKLNITCLKVAFALCAWRIIGREDRAGFLSHALKYPESNGSPNCASGSRSFMSRCPAGDGHKRRFGGQLYGPLGLLERATIRAVMLPNYLQTGDWLVHTAKAATPFNLVERMEGARMRWALDVDSLKRSVTSQNRAHDRRHQIPNNPDRGPFSPESEMDEIISCCPQGQSVAFGG